MIKSQFLFYFTCVFACINMYGQFESPDYLQYPFIKKEKNNLEIYGHKSWKTFFNKLDNQYSKGNEKVNILHIGGSHIQADIWSNKMRTNFQNALPFNQSGRGFVFPFRLINSNGSPVIKSSHTGRWKGYRNSVYSHNGPFGLMGARAELLDTLSIINIWHENPKIEYDSFSSVTLFYKDSNNFEIKILLDSNIEIKSKKGKESITFSFSENVDSLAIQIKKIGVNSGNFSFFGLYLDNDINGITYHSIGVNGASVKSYLRCENLVSELNWVKPDLVIFSIGINDAYEEDFSKDLFYQNYDTLIDKIKSVNPNVAILLTTNNDSYYKVKYPNERALEVQQQMKKLAENKNLAVWDMFDIMGGLNSIKEWEKNQLAKKDLIHLSFDGYNLIGDLLFDALIKSYIKYKKNRG